MSRKEAQNVDWDKQRELVKADASLSDAEKARRLKRIDAIEGKAGGA